MIPRLAAIFLSFSLVVAACSSGSADTTAPVTPTDTPSTSTAVQTSTTTSTSTTTTTTTIPAPSSPLNGLAAEDPALLDRRVIAVKIDNHWNARPQSGIQDADAVYELLVEAGLTRFIALFHDNDSAYLGPMRSGRPTDPTLLKPLGATFTISGAQDWVVSVIRSAGVSLIGEIRPATFRISSRFAPHNLYVDTSQLREYADNAGYVDEPPPPLFSWGDLPEGGQFAEEIAFNWSLDLTVNWTWTGSEYVRSTGGEPHNWVSVDGDEEQISADTLVVLFATRYTAYPSGSGSAVPAMDTVGSGRALVFSAGTAVEGTWSRSSTSEPFSLTDQDGSVIQFPAGRPWVSVFPDTREVDW